MRAPSIRGARLRSQALGCALVLGLAMSGIACSQQSILTTPRSFDRPVRSSFVCFDMSASPAVAVPLARCAPVDAAGTLPTNLDLHAIVLQSRRGEIAVVDLRTNAILDTNQTIPGYTFIEAGALPVDVVSTRGLNADKPVTTYVANAGSESVWVFAATKFRAPATTSAVDSQRVERDVLGGAPSALALSPDERFLFVAVPTLGVVLQFALQDDGSIDTASKREIDLAVDAPEPLLAEPESPLYRRECTSVPLALPSTAPQRIARSAATMPRPMVLLVDEETQELLVGDAALPVVHRFPIDAVAGIDIEAEPYAIGTPVSDLVLSPRVPSTPEQLIADRRYLYALDDTGAIAVMDVSDPLAFPAGRPLSVEIPAARAQDRITFDAPATSLAMVTTRDYDPAAPAPFCVAGGGGAGGEVGPARLHGVALAAALTDGSIRFVDVYDRDAACRGNTGAGSDACPPTGAAGASDAVVYVRRHRPRIGVLVSTELSVLEAPTMTLRGVPYSIGVSGTASSSSVPNLSPLDACDAESFVKVYPRDEPAPLICALGDPWAGLIEAWTATYEGTIVSGSAGRFDLTSEPNAFLAGETDFCRAGVIGTNGAVELGPGRTPALGDQLVITGELPPGRLTEMPTCADLVAEDPATRERLILAFEIIDADDSGRLEVASTSLGGGYRIDFVANCFDELVTFEVRSRASWVVRGSATGLSRARPDGPGACRVPVGTPDNDRLNFRAYSEEPFENRGVAFKIMDLQGRAVAGLALGFAVIGVPQKLGVNLTPGNGVAGSIPVDLFFSPFENRLYAVDAGRAALVRISVDAVLTERVFQ